jgi:multicomponent Na+:H+ antiporter subunit F
MTPLLIVQAAVVIMAIALVLAFLRLLIGPTVPDRVIAFDLLTLHVLGLVCAVAILTGQWLFLDAAIILALMTFMATVAFARYVERRARQNALEEPDA